MKNKNVKQKILFIAPSPFYLEKGSSLRMYSIAENLSSRYKLDIVTYSLGKNVKLKNTQIFRTPPFFKPTLKVGKPTFSKIILDLFMLIKGFKLILKNKYDIIHCEDFEGAFIGYVLSFFSSKSKKIYDLHNRITDNLDINLKKNYFRKIALYLEKTIVRRFDLMILNWNKYYNQDIFKNRKKFLYYDKINLNIEKYSIPKGKYIIYTGNFEPYQGVKEFLEVFKDIKSDIKLVLVGQSNEDIKNFINNNNLNDRVIMTGRLNIAQTNYLIKNAYFCILPRTYGIQPSTKMIHYLVLGKPILASNIEANREILKDNYNAILFDKNNIKNYLKKILSRGINFDRLKTGIDNDKNKILRIWQKDYFLKNYEK